MSQERQKVECFDLTDLSKKLRYEEILNRYAVVNTEFAYMKDGTPKVTVWYVWVDDVV
jgi:hypothetical protein